MPGRDELVARPLHGGAIGVQSAQQGTTFTVTLPRATGVRADKAQRFGLDEGASAASS